MFVTRALSLALAALILMGGTGADEIVFEGRADDDSLTAMEYNRDLFNRVLGELKDGDTFLVKNSTYWMQGGIYGSDFHNVRILIDGEIKFNDDRSNWPKNEDGSVVECIYLHDISNVTFTTSSDSPMDGKGVLNGNGRKWWGAIKFLMHKEDRPRLWHMHHTKNIFIRNLLLLDSPYWSFYSEQSDGLFIRHSDVSARITNLDSHDLYDLTAFNTDGWDVTGRNVHIADSNIWNQDDCISVKDNYIGPSEDMLFERITCSGLGLVIGSIGASQVRNITFRDSHLPDTFKGIYLKTRWSDLPADPSVASISDILYENILIERPKQWGIWIGPAQQTGNPCSLLWPHLNAECRMSGFQVRCLFSLMRLYVIPPPGLRVENMQKLL